MADPGDLVVPSDIPWPHFKGNALEELLYWLCDAMGAQDLQWRAGSASGTSRDRGRDLEATFHVPEPGGALRPQRWWFQAKGRSSTVPPGVVREAVVDVQAHAEVDVFVIATNSRVSNDTRDWVAEFQMQHPRPELRLWEQPDLERMVTAHPSVVARVAPQALSVAGQLAAASAAFWNGMQLPPSGQLDRFWADRRSLEFGTDALVMIVVAEAARHGLVRHPWGAELEVGAVTAALTLVLGNVAPLAFKAERGGHETEPLALAIAHLIGVALTRLPGDAVAGLIDDPWRFFDELDYDADSKEGLRRYLIEPAVQRFRSYFGSACMADCVRVFGELEAEESGSSEHRWYELLDSTTARPATPGADGFLLMEQQDAPCRAGLALDADHGCPFGMAGDDLPLSELLIEIETVVRNRLKQYSAISTDS